jgi:predicted ATPase
LIERAGALGEPPEDPLLLFSVLYGFWVSSLVAFNGEVVRELAAEFLTLAERQGTMAPLTIGHRLMGSSLMCTGAIVEARAHYDQALALYEPAEHRPLATRFGQDIGVATLSYRSLVLWLLGFPEAARRDAEQAIKDARAIDQAATLMIALGHAPLTYIQCGDYAAANAQIDELVALADKNRAFPHLTAFGMMNRGSASAMSGEPSKAVQMITSGIAAWRSTGSTQWIPLHLSFLAKAYAELDQFGDAWRCVDEAMAAIETTGEWWFEAEVNRFAGEIALKSVETGSAKAQAYFERSLTVARQQQAKSWELRAAMSLARLWRDQGKVQQARELLAPVYGWFTEGFDTRDLKEAKALLEELAA